MITLDISFDIPMLTWIVVVVAVVIFIAVTLARPLKKNHDARRVPPHKHHPMVEFGKEKDEFFIPGDPMPDADDDEDNERDNDLDRS